jgi:putative ABC transport system permease protein
MADSDGSMSRIGVSVVTTMPTMSELLNDLRVAIRGHLRQPGFSVPVVCTLALAIGATTAVFAVVNAVLVRGLPFAAPDRLVWVASVRADNPNAPFTLPEFIDYRSQTRALSGLAAFANWSASIAGDGITERLQGARMSANTFEVLGIQAAAGRLFRDSDDRPDAAPVVVISYRLWQRLYGGATTIVGQTVRINSEPFVVAGVLPALFPWPLRQVDVITPLVPDRDPLRYERNSVNFLRYFGRLAAGVSREQAQAELTTICRTLRQQFPVEYARKQAVRVESFHAMLVGDVRQSMLAMFAAVIVVLATALANLVSLSLVRASARGVELTMRAAIGATRAALMRQLAVEGAVLATAGSLIGLLLSFQAVRATTRWAPASIPRLDEVRFDATAVWLLVAITLAVTLVLTLVPMLAAMRGRAGDALRPASRGSIGDRWNQRVRSVMVAAEVAASTMLLLATFVLVQHLRQLQSIDPGFSGDGVFQARVAIPPAYRSPEEIARFYDRLAERLRAVPGVEQLSVISAAPLSGLLGTVPFVVAGRSTSSDERSMATFRIISPGYLSTMGTRLVQGRAFEERDREDTPRVALVSAALADRLLAGRAVGQRLLINDNNVGPRPVEIVGVVENVRHAALDVPPAMDIYLPLRQVHADGTLALRNNQFWLIKTSSDPAAFGGTFVAQLRAVDPEAAVSDPGTVDALVAASLGPRRFTLGLFAAFAMTAVFLAMGGLYGLVSYTVAQRAPEIGLRMAIGATHADVRRMILRQAIVLGGAGTAAGAALAAATRPLIAQALQDAAVSPLVVISTTVAIIGVVLVAAWLPARRAARIEPTLALRAQ